MEKITLVKRFTKSTGDVKLRFRLREGRAVQLFYKSGIKCDISKLQQFDDSGDVKQRVTVYDEQLADHIQKVKANMMRAYRHMKEHNLVLSGEVLEREVAKLSDDPADIKPKDKGESLADRFERWIDDNTAERGKERQKSYKILQKELRRYLHMNGRKDITPAEFTADMVNDFAQWLSNEWQYVDSWPQLYWGMTKCELPHKRGANYITAKMKELKCFFRSLEQKEEISRSPFARMDESERRAIVREQYDEPVALTLAELKAIASADLTERMARWRDLFTLQCFTGARISDFMKWTRDNLAVVDGVPVLHYIPQKTSRISRKEVETPLMKSAFLIFEKFDFSVAIAQKDYYNKCIRDMLQAVGIDRKVPVTGEEGQTIYKPVWAVASSKLARKTFVSIMANSQIDMYAAGLHKRGSAAVQRYTHIELAERFRLMCFAFDEPHFAVDDALNIIAGDQANTHTRLAAFLATLSDEEKNELRKLLK